jgi:hypothetical protein
MSRIIRRCVSVAMVSVAIVTQTPVSLTGDPESFLVSNIGRTTNGAAAGTTLVKDINPGADGSNPAGLAVVGGSLFYSPFSRAEDFAIGRELWAFQISQRLSSVSSGRVYESRSGPDDKTIDGKFQATGRRADGVVTELTITDRAGVSAGASAVFLNVVAVMSQRTQSSPKLVLTAKSACSAKKPPILSSTSTGLCPNNYPSRSQGDSRSCERGLTPEVFIGRSRCSVR